MYLKDIKNVCMYVCILCTSYIKTSFCIFNLSYPISLISLILELTLLVNIWPDFVYFGCCIQMYTCNVGYQIVTDLFVCLLYFSYFLLRVLFFFSFSLSFYFINKYYYCCFWFHSDRNHLYCIRFFFVVNILKMGLCELLNY